MSAYDPKRTFTRADECRIYLGNLPLLRQYTRSDEQKAGRRGYFCVGTALCADEDKSCSPVYEDQNDGLTSPCVYRGHSDVKKFADRLVEILQPQQRTNLGRCKRKAMRLSTRIDVPSEDSVGMPSSAPDTTTRSTSTLTGFRVNAGRARICSARSPIPQPAASNALRRANVFAKRPNVMVFQTLRTASAEAR
jgi:hypothetical protein